MADVILRPSSGVYDWHSLPSTPPAEVGSGYVPPATVGAAPQWGDQSDASYSRHETHYWESQPGVWKRSTSYAAADFDALEFADTIATTIHVRVMAETGTINPSNVYGVWVGLFDRVTGERLGWNDPDVDMVPADQSIYELACAIGFPGVGQMEKAAASLAAGNLSAECMVRPTESEGDAPNTGTYWSRCYEFWVAATTAPPSLTPEGAPLRVVQRGSDGLGLTGGRRAFGHTTIHASNRRGPGVR